MMKSLAILCTACALSASALADSVSPVSPQLEQFSVRLDKEQARRQYRDRRGQSRSPSRSDGGDPAARPNGEREATQYKPLKTALAVEDSWVRWLPSKRPSAAYMTLKNQSAQSVDLISASSPDYAHVSVHQSIVQDDKSKMVTIDRLPIPAHGEVKLMPGGYHLMLEQAKRDIAPGDTVRIELHFSNGAALEAELPVRLPASN